MIRKMIPSFTLMEVTVAMLLASIVISVSYAAWSLVSHAYLTYHDKNQELLSNITLCSLLEKDFDRADRVIRTEKGVDVVDQKGVISYYFKERLVLRNQYNLQTDTFKVIYERFFTFFDHHQQHPGEIIDEIYFVCHTGTDEAPFVINKIYCGTTLFRQSQLYNLYPNNESNAFY